MPRSKKHTPETLIASALDVFWRNGYSETSLEDLVRETGVSRHGIYSEFGSKRGLFAAVFDVYQRDVVGPAFSPVEAASADVSAIATYYDYQIDRAEAQDSPALGCMMTNTINENTSHDKVVLACIQAHNDRFLQGFENAILNTYPKAQRVEELAQTLLTFTHGLWSMGRLHPDTRKLRDTAHMFLSLFSDGLTKDFSNDMRLLSH